VEHVASSEAPGGSVSRTSPFAVEAAGPLSTGGLLWRLGRRLRATLILVATFEVQPGGFMRLGLAEPVALADISYAGGADRSLSLSTDLVPFLPRADILLTGHACAPACSTARGVVARLALAREKLLLDKSIQVIGDERGARPFQRMPLVYERAFGGPRFPDNPVGTGAAPGSASPNLIHPSSPTAVACFGPLRRDWPARAGSLRGVDLAELAAPVPALPTAFDMSFFHAAPADQRVDYLHGDEWLLLEGLSPTLPQIRTRLPVAAARARIWGHPDLCDGRAIDLVCDTMRIDADRGLCSLVWRGSFPLPSEESLWTLRVIAGVTTNQFTPEWPAAFLEAEKEHPAPRATVGSTRPPPRARRPSTLPPPPSAPTPPSSQRSTLETTQRLDQTAALPSRGDSTVAISDSTLAMDERAEGAARERPAVPFRAGPSTLPPPAAPASHVGTGKTIALDDRAAREAKARPAVPFGAPPPAVLTGSPPSPEAPESAMVAPNVSFSEPEPEPPAVVYEPEPAPAPAPRETTPEGIRIVNDTSFACTAIPWGLSPSRACFTVIAKASADLAPKGPAKLRPRADAPTNECAVEEGDLRVVVYPSDLVPFKARADVVLVGHAYAPGGEATQMDVEMSLGAGENSIVRKIRVFGDRQWTKGFRGGASPPSKFARMPLRWERAFGGPTSADNPVGSGLVDRSPGGRGPGALANLEHADSPVRVPSQKPAPACPAPLPLAWAERRSPGVKAAPWPFFPEDLDWTRYQAAPPEQRLAFLRGDEPFSLTGVHPTEAAIEGALPGVRARCFALRAESGVFEEVPLRLDTVVFSTDESKLDLVFRGWLPVPDEARPGIEALFFTSEPTGVDPASLDVMRDKLLDPSGA